MLLATSDVRRISWKNVPRNITAIFAIFARPNHKMQRGTNAGTGRYRTNPTTGATSPVIRSLLPASLRTGIAITAAIPNAAMTRWLLTQASLIYDPRQDT